MRSINGVLISLPLDARDGRDAISYVVLPAGREPETHGRRDSNVTDRTTLPPEAAESHTHLAHAVIRYLGLTAPEELVPFGINNAAGIVDLISRVTDAYYVSSLILFSEKNVFNYSGYCSLQRTPSRLPHRRWHHSASAFLLWLRWSIIHAIRTLSSYSRDLQKIPQAKNRKRNLSQYVIYHQEKR